MSSHEKTREDEFLALAATHQPKFRRLARAYGRGTEAEDLLQEIWLQIWRSLPTFDGKSHLATWAWRVALNTCLGHRRSSRIEPEVLEEGASPAPTLGDASSIFEDFAGRLNAIDRAVLLLHLDNREPAEAAEIIGISRNAIAIRLTRIRKLFESHYLEN